jgi:TRAP-type C4-dicarboxylate transport system permease small subunit
MKELTKVILIFDKILDYFMYLTGAAVVFMILSVFAEVFVRLLFGFSIQWVVEINEYLIFYMAFLGTAWLLRREGHVKVDILLNVLPPRGQDVLNAITSIICAMLCLVVTYFSALTTIDLFQRHTRSLTLMATPMGYLIGIIPIGCFLLFIQFLRRTCKYIQGAGEIKREVKS